MTVCPYRLPPTARPSSRVSAEKVRSFIRTSLLKFLSSRASPRTRAAQVPALHVPRLARLQVAGAAGGRASGLPISGCWPVRRHLPDRRGGDRTNREPGLVHGRNTVSRTKYREESEKVVKESG